MAVIKSGASTDQLTVDATSKAARTSLYDAAGRDLSFQSKPTYSCVTANFTPAATPTDLFKIVGSATKTIRVIDIRMGGTATAASMIDLFLIRRSTDDTIGTFVPGTAVKHDTNDANASAVVGHYTANPTLGNTVGTISHRKVSLPIATSVGEVNSLLLPDGGQTLLDKPITLRGITEALVLNFAGAAVPAGGASWYVVITWIEE